MVLAGGEATSAPKQTGAGSFPSELRALNTQDLSGVPLVKFPTSL